MTDIRIPADYLDDLLAKLADGRINPARFDHWVLAQEMWQAVRAEVERLRQELDRAQHALSVMQDARQADKRLVERLVAERDELARLAREAIRDSIERPKGVVADSAAELLARLEGRDDDRR